MIKNILTLADIEAFATCIMEELGMGFHPDDPFEDYIDFKTGKRLYTTEEARLRNALIGQAFLVCEREKADLYEMIGRVMVRGTEREGMFG